MISPEKLTIEKSRRLEFRRVLFRSPEKLTIQKSLRLGFLATNNEAEYEALLEGISIVQKLGGNADRKSVV